ncbi:nuclear transport factor 2 family protein [Streptodolium elevatio]|uniref:Nuclear transport factor 2 family protein n=1 Tax=Streptodolium elevatio TaxID=3157996 RepID=A0ABV3DRE2_9ACTN
MTQTAPSAVRPAVVTPELYLSVQQFYARHMQAVDDDNAEVWADDYTEDAEFDTDALPAPLFGRGTILARLAKAGAALAEQGVTRRHLMSMLTVHPESPDSAEGDVGADAGDGADGGEPVVRQVRTRSSFLVLHSSPGTPTTVFRSGIWEDTLVRSEGGPWRMRRRRVVGDGAAHGAERGVAYGSAAVGPAQGSAQGPAR